jgi:hypothetical protein
VRPRWSGVAPGRDHGICNLHQGASGALGHARVARPKGSSEEEPAGAPGARSRRALLAIGLFELGYEAAPLTRNCCCYCGGGLDSSFGSGLVIGGVARKSKRRCDSPSSKLASQPSRRVGRKRPICTEI